jgi:hypothetical protein
MLDGLPGRDVSDRGFLPAPRSSSNPVRGLSSSDVDRARAILNFDDYYARILVIINYRPVRSVLRSLSPDLFISGKIKEHKADQNHSSYKVS